jgi:hypothetical protein
MTFLITYFCQQHNEQRILEWVAPAGWGLSTIGRHFEERFPRTQILRIDPQP